MKGETRDYQLSLQRQITCNWVRFNYSHQIYVTNFHSYSTLILDYGMENSAKLVIKHSDYSNEFQILSAELNYRNQNHIHIYIYE